ncbi:MAG: DUF4139 domain-containing protein [Cyclobacteriaceae bacterium]|nr:MAG: DUF4139 domain-containing protein [Cyclobacteriaceae bacterium]
MKRISLILVLIGLMLFAEAQTEKQVDSKISRVTVFLNRAQVTRELKTRVEAGRTNLILSGLTANLDQQSIQVSGKGAITILGINHNQNYLSDHNRPKSLQVLYDSLEFYRKQLLQEQHQNEVLSKEEQLLLSNQKIGGTNQNLSVNELKAMADFYRSRLSDIGTGKIKSDERIKKINERITKLNQQIREQNDLYNRNTSEIVVSVSADAATAVELEVNYIVANAGWYPVYDLRAANTRSPVQLNYKANVFQSTGEEWKNVRLKLSTANPSLGGVKPELFSWYLDFYQPYVKALQGRAAGVQVQRTMKPQDKEEIQVEFDIEVPEEAATISDFTQTIQTSLNTEFDISLPYTVSSASKPTLVDIRNHEMKAEYLYSTAPKIDQDAFLLARATGWEEFSLLPGEANVFFEGTFVGKSYIDPNVIKDTLSVSLGRDKRIVVKREKVKDFTTRRTIGSNIRESFAWEVSVRNTKNEAVKILVEDQVPVSRNSQIEVTVLDIGGAKYNKDTGKLVWEMNLQPNETKKVVFKYEVKYPKDKTISGL